jgi:hypothetical protein
LRDESELHGAGDIIVFMGGERRSDKPGERYGMHAAKRGEILPDFGRKASSGAGFHGQSLVTWPMSLDHFVCLAYKRDWGRVNGAMMPF